LDFVDCFRLRLAKLGPITFTSTYGRNEPLDCGHLRLFAATTTTAFHQTLEPTQRTQRKKRNERNEVTPLLDRPNTAASDDGVCRWHAAKLWQTHAIKYELIEIKFDLHHKFHNK